MRKNFLLAAAMMLAGVGLANAEVEVDLTPLVGTSQSDWNGSGLYEKCGTVSTAAGEAVNMVERYYGSRSGMDVGVTPLHQTVSLPNGSYTVTLYATANAAWGICGDTALSGPSTTAVSAYANEVKLPITASNETDYSNPQEYTMNVTVTNGALELGLVINEEYKANWYTIQIKSLSMKAASEEAAYNAVVASCKELLAADAEIVTGEERDAFQTAIDANNGLKSLLEALSIYQLARPYYVTLADAKAYAKTVIAECTYASTESVAALNAILSIKAGSAEDAEETTLEVIQGYRDVAMSNAYVGIDPNAEDLVDCFENPDAYEGLAGWDTEALDTKPNGDETPIYDVYEEEKYPYFDAYNGNGVLEGYAEQTINVPAGQLRLSVLSRGSSADSFDYYRMTVSGAATGSVDMPCNFGNSGGLMGNGWSYAILDLDSNGGDLTVSITWKAVDGSTGKWISFTDFQLYKYSLAGVDSVEVEKNGEVKYYDLSGYQVKADKLSKGIYIKTQNGKAQKFIVK